MESVDIQLQQVASKNWTTMGRVANIGYNVQHALDQLKKRFPNQAVRAMLNGALINMIP